MFHWWEGVEATRDY